MKNTKETTTNETIANIITQHIGKIRQDAEIDEQPTHRNDKYIAQQQSCNGAHNLC